MSGRRTYACDAFVVDDANNFVVTVLDIGRVAAGNTFLIDATKVKSLEYIFPRQLLFAKVCIQHAGVGMNLFALRIWTKPQAGLCRDAPVPQLAY